MITILHFKYNINMYTATAGVWCQTEITVIYLCLGKIQIDFYGFFFLNPPKKKMQLFLKPPQDGDSGRENAASRTEPAISFAVVGQFVPN